MRPIFPLRISIIAILFVASECYGFQQPDPDKSIAVVLTAPAGTPLRPYVTKRFTKRSGAPVTAKILEPVYAFNKQVIPSGASVTGAVTRVQPVSKWERVQAILRGDFTPLRIAQVEFDSVALPDGRSLAIRTAETPGLNSIYNEPRPKC